MGGALLRAPGLPRDREEWEAELGIWTICALEVLFPVVSLSFFPSLII